MTVNFILFKNKLSWSVLIHQLNGDILSRHVMLKDNMGNVGIDFSYCEKSQQGNIVNSLNECIGRFSISS